MNQKLPYLNLNGYGHSNGMTNALQILCECIAYGWPVHVYSTI